MNSKVILMFLFVAGAHAPVETRVVEGYLIDQKCASYYRESQPKKLSDHSRGCVVACGREGGYGLISADQYTSFDSKGSRLAQQWLERPGEDKDLHVSVTFEEENGTLKVIKIE